MSLNSIFQFLLFTLSIDTPNFLSVINFINQGYYTRLPSVSKSIQ